MMLKQRDVSKDERVCRNNEAGFILVAAMVVLLALTMFGIWAIRTSTLELDIAGSMQRAEKGFNVSEGSVAIEAANVGFTTQAYYEVKDPSQTNTPLVPATEAEFDPGGDTSAAPAAVSQTDPETWPMQNLLRDAADDEFDYRYLVTYLYADVPPKGYDAASFSGYMFRIEGQSMEGNVGSLVIEVGGTKVGPKAAL
ncbi:MAG: hypothetical protein KKH22_11680 [Proteobacteria bacterium]|nr:hypothetical protein [Pseudomonadota bacterium]